MRRRASLIVLLSAGVLCTSACGGESPTTPSQPPPPLPTYSLSGIVREALPSGTTGLPIRSVRLEVVGKPGVIAATLTDADGSYRFDGVAGTFKLRVSRAGYEPRTVSVGPVTSAQAIELALNPVPRPLTGVVLETPPTHTVAIAGARVEVASGPNTGAFATTDSSGRYTLPSMWGEFDVRVTRQGYDPRVLHVEIGDADVRMDIQLGPTARLVVETFGQDFVSHSGVFRAFVQVHNPGEIAITDWAAYGFEEGDGSTLQIWEEGRLIAQTYVERSMPRQTTMLKVPVVAGRTYEVRAVPQFWWYTITFTHPN